MDNYAGINIGMLIIKEKLPAFLSERYNYDQARVDAKLEHLVFDWADFDSYSCSIEGVPVADRLKKLEQL